MLELYALANYTVCNLEKKIGGVLLCYWLCFTDLDVKSFKEVIDTNVMGLTICTQQALKLMKESGVDDGHIIHINSVVGHSIPNTTSNPTMNVYPASKYAVTALTESLRQELVFLKSKIRVTVSFSERSELLKNE